MREAPEKRIEQSAIKVWRLHGLIYLCFFIVVTGIIAYFTYAHNWSKWILISSSIVTIIIAILAIAIPAFRWRRWRYQLFEQEIYIQHGMLIIERTLVPMVRVQHVDTKQGPILKKFRLASLEISTAATTHQIPALSEEEAEQLRDQISILARVEQDDV
ncbi:hypothetical protein SAMN04488134_10268 [Amphibacillus marinus]|uniref:YdbS-like PH domain-containing protein n=1 Tax=Amphibacillus marinus TaxID=872970 RepID=A0A1H8JTC8_9BACI|nr:PH domain-containing protein [Amphibacillus marinus]SEN84003.1 hypothetical protein SAMN04488134_10268 [Amphibacillus marinus]